MAMSFAGNAKAEICRVLPQKKCCALSQCFGILLFCNHFSANGIRIITESREFGYILPKLFLKAFDLEFDSFPSLESPGKLVFQMDDPQKLEQILGAFGFAARTGKVRTFQVQTEHFSFLRCICSKSVITVYEVF